MRIKSTLPILTLAAAGFLFASIPLRADPPPACDLDTKKIIWSAPTGYSKLEGGKLTVNVPPGVKSTAIFGITGTIPACMIESAMALKATVRARGRDIRKPEISYLGVKFQFRLYDAMTGMSRYPNTPTVKCGSFDWRELEVFAVLGGLQTGQDATLSLGLQGTSGEIEFDMSSLSIKPVTDIFPRENADHVACYSPDVRNMGQMRGVMLTGGRDLTEDDFREMSSWGVKLGRYQIIRGWNAWTKGPTDTDLAEYDAWIGTRLDHLEKTVLPMARKYGMKIVVDVHSPPGGRNQAGEMMMFYDTRFRDHFIALWKRIATRFKGNTDAIYGYDLVNEPQQLRPAKHDYWSVQRDAADAVRRIDPHTPIIIESNNMDTPATFAYLNPLTLTNVIYSVHMYIPSDYTHQGVLGGGPMPYPDPKRGRNRDWLRKTLGNVREFQNRHGARIYVGEFSAAAWAEGADRYIEDCISIFEEYGWDWTYHSFRGWNGWSVEHEGPNIKNMRPSSDNARKRTLLKGLARRSLLVGAVNCGAFAYPPPDGTAPGTVTADWRRLATGMGTDLLFFEDIGKGLPFEDFTTVRDKSLDVALKTALSVKSVSVVSLPGSEVSCGTTHRTSRCRALRAVVDSALGELAVYGVHLVAEGHIPREKNAPANAPTPSQILRRRQFEALLADAARYDRAIIAGDFNAQTPAEYTLFAERGWTVANGSHCFGTHATLRTIPADNVIVSPHLNISWFEVPDRFRLNTDHRPVFARIELKPSLKENEK